MQGGVGGAGDGHVHVYGVDKRVHCKDGAGAHVFVNQRHAPHAGPLGQRQPLAVIGRHGAVAGHGYAQGFGQAVHGVRREQAGAGAAAGAGVEREFFLLRLGHIPAFNMTHGFNACAVIGGVGAVVAGGHRAAGHHYGGNVHSGGRHYCSGDGLVAVYDEHQPVQPVGHGHGLYAVGNELAAGQGVHHALVGHGYSVADGYGRKFHWYAACGGHAQLYRLGYAAQVKMAGDYLVEGVYDTDKRLAADLL